MPQWMRPDRSGVIVVFRETSKEKIPYLEVSEYTGKMTSEVLSFLFMHYAGGVFQNINYQIDGGWNRVGSKEFLADMSS